MKVYELIKELNKHNLNNDLFPLLGGIYKELVIKNNCWIGSHVVVLLGVEIAKNCVIAANSVVLNNVNENSLFAGSPAIKKK